MLKTSVHLFFNPPEERLNHDLHKDRTKRHPLGHSWLGSPLPSFRLFHWPPERCFARYGTCPGWSRNLLPYFQKLAKEAKISPFERYYSSLL